MRNFTRFAVPAAVVLIAFAGLAPSTARGTAARRSTTVAPATDSTTDWPVLVAFAITPKTLKNNRINLLKLTFRFQDDGKNLLGGKLDLKLQYSNTSLPHWAGRASVGIHPPLINWPAAWTYPLTQTVFQNATGEHTIVFDFLGETWKWVKITGTLTDRAGHKGASRQITLHRSTAASNPEQGSEINDLAYTFSLLNQARKQIKLSTYLGKVILIQFSFWNCPYCQTEASHLEALYQKYKSQGFQALTVMLYNVNNQPMLPEDCKKWAQTFGLTTPVLADTFAGVWDPYLRDTHGYSAPYTFLIDRTGKIRAIYAGYSPAIASTVEAKIKKLLAE